MCSSDLLEYDKSRNKLKELEDLNPTYNNTTLMATIHNLLNTVNFLVQAQDLQRDSLKKAMKNMIEINQEQYELNEENQYKKLKARIEKEYSEKFNKVQTESIIKKGDIRIEKKEEPIEIKNIELTTELPTKIIEEKTDEIILDTKKEAPNSEKEIRLTEKYEDSVMDKLKKIADS